MSDWRDKLDEPHGLSDRQLLGAFLFCLVLLASLLVSVYVGYQP